MPDWTYETYTYDVNGNLITTTDAKGQVTTNTYNSMNRLTNTTFADNSTIAYTYNQTGKLASTTEIPLLRGGASGDGVEHYTYNAQNRLTQVTYPDGKIISYAYDINGNKLSTTTYDGVNVWSTTNTYTALNQLKSVTDASGGITWYYYDLAGRKTGEILPNGNQTTYNYDSQNRLVYLEHGNPATHTILASYSYTYDATGNRTRVVENTGRTVDYSYDSLNRLISETVNGTDVTVYSYDSVGNRLTKNDNGAVTTYAYDGIDRLLTETIGTETVSYTYDANGNTISRTDSAGTTSYTYGARDKLLAVNKPDGTALTYEYDAKGNRIQKNVNGSITNFLIDENQRYAQVAAEYDGVGNLLADYAFGDRLLSQTRNGQTSYFGTDAIGSTRILTDSSGAVTDTADYDAWGVSLGSTGSTDNSYRFQSQFLDNSLNQYYLRARNYDPNRGAFTSRDSFDGFDGNPITLNKYLAFNANPLTYTDPSGEFSIAETGVTLSLFSTLDSIAMPNFQTKANSFPKRKIHSNLGGVTVEFAQGANNPVDIRVAKIFEIGVILAWMDTKFNFKKIWVSATTNGVHSCECSLHYVKNGSAAIDISRINGKFMSNDYDESDVGVVTDVTQRLQRQFKALGAYEIYGPDKKIHYKGGKYSFVPGHDNHIHLSVK